MSSPNITRRQLIKAGGAALALSPLFLPARARGANDRIRLAMVGVGKHGNGHLKWFADQDDVEIRAICDVEEQRRELARGFVERKNQEKKRTGVNVTTTVDYKDLLARDDIDALLIATPDHWHALPLIHAAQARKDVYCEKPLTLTIEESELCVRAVRKHKIVMQTGSQQRSENDGRFRIASEYIRSGRLGRITRVHAHFGGTSKSCDLPEEALAPGLDWDRWLGQAPQRGWHHVLCGRGAPETYPFLPGWRDYREYSGGLVTDWGAHHLDIVQWALGMDGSGPTLITPPPKGADPRLGGVELLYKKTPVGDDILVVHKTYGNGIRFFGTEGELWVNRDELITTPATLLKKPIGDGDVRLEDGGGIKGSHRRNWLDCIRSRRDPICRVEVGAGSAAVCHLLNLAYWNQRPVRWNAATWTMPGAPAAWKSRRARKGYELPKV